MSRLVTVAAALCWAVALASSQTPDDRTAEQVVRPVVDRIIRETSFELKAVPLKPTLDIQVIDFGALYGKKVSGIACAFNVIESGKDTILAFGLSRDLPLALILNGKTVFSGLDVPPFHFRESGYEIFQFNDTLRLGLRKGDNTLLLKSRLVGDRNVVYLRELSNPRSRPFSRFNPASFIPAIKENVWSYIGLFEDGMEMIVPPELGYMEKYVFEGKELRWQYPPAQSVQELVIKPDAAFRRESYAEWQYPNGTVMLALLDYAAAARDISARDFVGRFCQFTVERMGLFKNQYENLHAFRGTNHRLFRRGMLDDTGAPALPFVEMALQTTDHRLDTLVREIAQYIRSRQGRLSDGTLCRPERFLGTVWADDLFMSAPFLMRAGNLFDDPTCADDAIRQAINFNKYLRDKSTGLYRHGWYNLAKRQSPFAWGRANGWVVWATSEILRLLPTTHPRRAEIARIFHDHMKALIKWQAMSGLWHQVLDRPESYEETSCSAMFLIGLSRGIRMGILDESFEVPLRKAWSGLRSRISSDGIVKGICRGTEMSDDYEFYATREQFDNDPRGMGAVITACLEMMSLVAKSYPPERMVIVPADSGREVIQWTQQGRNNHLYFNIESFIDRDHFLFYSDRSGKLNIFVMNMSDGTMTQLTDESDLTQTAWHLPQFHTLWYLAGSELKSVNTLTRAALLVHRFENGRPESFAITCDGRYCVFGANKHPGFTRNHSTGPYALFRLDLKTGAIKQISPDLGFKIGHVQTSPTDPGSISYCWQHVYVDGAPGVVGNTPNRIWWNNVEGTNGGPVGIQEFGLHRTHEFWFPDGSRMGYSARYLFGPNKGKQFIGIITPDGRENFMMAAPVSSSHNQIFSDSKHWVSDLYDGPNLVLFTIERKEIVKKEILYKHGSSMEGQPSHPHPHFSPDGKVVLFSTDKSGRPQVYTVKTHLQ